MQCNSAAEPRQPIVFTRGPYILIDGLNFKQREHLKSRLTIQNPAYEIQKRFAGWVGNKVPRFLKGYAEVGEAFYVAPGAAQICWRELVSTGSACQYRADSPIKSPFCWTYSGEPRPYQDAALAATSRRRSGCIIAPCGSGKTDIGCRIIQQVGGTTLIIVHTKELLHQWVSRIKARLGLDAAIIGGGKKKNTGASPITVATVQTLIRNAEMLAGFRNVELLLVDECHHTPCSTFTEVVRSLDPDQRYGFTATPERADGTTALMHWWLGETIARVDRDELEQNGHILRPTLQVHPLESLCVDYNAEDPGSYLRVMQALLADEPRFDSIVVTIKNRALAGGYHLVLTGSVEYGNRLFGELDAGFPCCFIHGSLPKVERARILEDARNGFVQILIATTLADEGLDLPIFDQVHLVTPTRSASKATQRAGRVCRPHPGKGTPIIHDYVDLNVTTATGGRLFINQFRSRLKAFREFAQYDHDDVRRILRWGKERAR